MVTRPLLFKQSDVKRAVAGAKAAGLEVGRVEIDRDGKIVIFADRSGGGGQDEPAAVLDNRLRRGNHAHTT